MEKPPLVTWGHLGDKHLPTAAFELECEVVIPEGAAKGQALLLLEFPRSEHLPSTCACQVNGRAVPLQERSSAGHVGDDEFTPESPWRDLLPYTSSWTWYIVDLDSGPAEVRFNGFLPVESCKFGLWAWTDWELSRPSVSVPIECPEPAMPQCREHWKRRGICILSPGMGFRVRREMSPTPPMYHFAVGFSSGLSRYADSRASWEASFSPFRSRAIPRA